MNIETFLNILRREALLNVRKGTDITNDDDTALANRIKIQKYVYLAKYFNIDLDFDYATYNMYLHGPYSPDLAEEYYRLADEGFFESKPDNYDSIINNNTNLKIFIEFMKEDNRNDAGWLEVASTALSFAKNHTNKEKLVDHVAYVKYRFDKEYVKRVIEVLEKSSLLILKSQ
ncbi:MAG: hypothetical protein QW776_03115 [Candidatus Nitrosocaldus sp.]